MASIVLMEDDVDLADSWALVLSKAGHEVAVTHSAESAMQELLAGPKDLLISDIFVGGDGQPQGYGGTLLLGRLQVRRNPEDLKQYPWLGPLKVLAVSGGGRQALGFDPLASARELGADRTLRKPINNKTLLCEIDTLLASQGRP